MVAQAGSKLEILLSQSPECWNDRCILLCSACQWNFWFCIGIIQRKSLRKLDLIKALHKQQQVQCGWFIKEDKASTFQLCDFGKLIKSPWPVSPVIVSNNSSTFAQSKEYEVPSVPCQSRSNLRLIGQQWRQSTNIYETSITCQGGIGRTKRTFLLKEKIKRTSQKMI